MLAGSGKFPVYSVRANLPEELEENIRDAYRLMIAEEGGFGIAADCHHG